MRSVMQHSFGVAPSANIPRSSFDRTHGHKTTLDAGFLVPVYVDEALPGDTHAVRMQGFGRLATPIHPIMDNIFMDTQFFAVPIRLVWDNWQRFNGEQDNPSDSTDFTIPTMTVPASTGHGELSLSDYFGIPTKVDGFIHISLFHRAYNLIYNEWYRDQNLQDSVVVDTDDGPDDPADYVLLRRGKRHDYFTSCLPWPQKGDSVDLPLGSQAPITGLGLASAASASAGASGSIKEAGAQTSYTDYFNTATVTGNIIMDSDVSGASGEPAVFADLSNATAATINQLRQAFQIQKMLERDARGGTRYIEVIRAHFGVISPDHRLQRPEYLGGGSSPINVHPVPQTSETGTTAQGNLAAYGTVALNNHGFTKSFTEHCLIIGIASVRADLTYQQGLHRMWSRQTRFDFYWPALSHIGEQAVLNTEIYTQGAAADALVFGYQERHAEYRYMPSKITGLFRSNATASLDVWHLSQEFTSLPVLNSAFIQEDPPIDRVIEVPSEPHFILDMHFRVRSARPMPMFGVPGLIDHF